MEKESSTVPTPGQRTSRNSPAPTPTGRGSRRAPQRVEAAALRRPVVVVGDIECAGEVFFEEVLIVFKVEAIDVGEGEVIPSGGEHVAVDFTAAGVKELTAGELIIVELLYGGVKEFADVGPDHAVVSQC